MRFILFNDDSNNSTHAASNDAAVGKSLRKKCRTKIAWPNIKKTVTVIWELRLSKIPNCLRLLTEF
jgi:hypothetical protein